MATQTTPSDFGRDGERAPTPPPHAHHTGRRIGLLIGGLLVLLVVAALAAVYVLTNTDWGREKVRTKTVSILNSTGHGKFTVGRISGNLLKGLTLHELAITDSAGAPFLRVDSATTKYGLGNLVSRRISLTGVTLWRPVVVLDRPPNGRWNWDRIFPTDTTQTKRDTTKLGFGDYVVVHDLRLIEGDITVRVPWSPDTTLRGAARDSVIRIATDTTTTLSRFRVLPAPGGYQQVQFYRHVTGHVPLARLKIPHQNVRRIAVDSLRLLAYPFRLPGADIRQLQGIIDMDADSLWFRNANLGLADSRARLTGRYGLNTGDLFITGTGAPVALADVRFLMPALPDTGTGTLGFRVAIGTAGVSRYRFTNVDLRASSLTMRGDLGFSFMPLIRIDTTNVTFAGLDTKLLEQLVPVAKSPRRGTLAGRLAADGDLARLTLDGDVAFDDPRSGRSRLIAEGTIGQSNGAVQANALRVRVAPMQVALAKIFAPTLPVGGTVNGSLTVNGSTTSRLNVSAIDLTHLDRGERSRIVGRAAVTMPAFASSSSTPSAPAPSTPAPPRRDANSPAPPREADRPRIAGRGRATWFDVDLRAQPVSLVTIGRFAPALGLRGTATGPIRVSGTTQRMALDASLGVSDGGRIAAVGQLGLGTVPTYDLTVATRLFNAKTVATKAPATSLTARMVARGRGTDPATMVASLDADLTTSTIDTVAIDSSKIRVRAAGGLLTVDTLAVRAPRTAVDLLGTFGLAAGHTGELSYLASSDSLGALARYIPKRDSGAVSPRPAILAARVARARADSIAQAQRNAVRIAVGERTVARVPVDTPSTIARDSLAGAVYLAGVMKGNITSFDVHGRAGAVKLVAFGSTLQRARFAYAGLAVRTPQQSFAVAGVADSVSAAGFALDSVDVRGAYREPGGNLQLVVYQNKGSDLAARADFGIYTDRRELRLGELRLRFDTTTWTATRPSTIWWGQPGTEIRSLELTNGAGGRLFVDGQLPSAGAANLRVELSRFQVADALGLLQSDVPLRGFVGLNATLTGPLVAPVIHAIATVDSATYDGTVLPDLRSTADYTGGRLTANAEARAYVPVAVAATDTRGRRRRNTPPPPPPELRTIAVVNGSLPINLALQGVTGPRMADDAPVVADFRMDSLPLDVASRFTDVVSDVRGTARGTGTVRGTVKKPDINGDVTLDSAAMRITAAGILLKDLNGAIHLRGDSVVIDSVAGRTDRRIAIAGGIGISTPSNPTFDLRLNADNALVLDNEMGRIKADAQISMYGPMNGVFMSGGARVRGGVIYIPEPDSKEVISQGDPAVFAVIDTSRIHDSQLVPAQSPLLANLRTDISLAVDRDTWVRSREANVEIYSDGDLRIRVDRAKQAIVLDGIVNTDRGQYTFLSKRFQVKSGSATFIGTQELDPNLQLVAEYEVPQNGPPLAIRILVGGTVTAPRISLESDAQPPIPQSDLLSYLAFGNNTGQLLSLGTGSSVSTSSAGGGLVGTTAALAQKQLASVVTGVMVDQLESKTGRALGADVFNITPVSGLPDELASRNFGNGLDQFVRGTQIEFGKYFNRQLYVALQGTPVFFQGQPPIPGFVVQYRFANLLGLILESNWQPRYFLPPPSLSTQDINPKNAFGLFFTRQWRF